MADNTNEYIEYHGILSGLRLVYATESLLDDRLFLRGYFKTPSSITSCRRDERNLRRDERVVRVGQGAVFGIGAS